MMLLAIDTSTHMLGLGLHSGQEVLAESLWLTDRYHTVELGPQIALMLRRSRVSISDLEAVAVALGPGSYTGLRIGVALAKGLALARGLALIGVSTFDILASAQPARTDPIFCLIEAGRGRVAGLWYKWGRRGWQPEGEPTLVTWEDLPAMIEPSAFLVGDLGRELRDKLGDLEGVEFAAPSACVRRPSVLAEIAHQRLRSGKLPDAASLAPVYLNTP